MNDILYIRIFWILFNKSFQRQITNRFDIIFSKAVMKRARVNYYNILKNAPSVGKHNPKLTDILFTALVAAIYKAGEGKITPAQIGSIMTDGMESVYVFRKSFRKNNHFSKKWQDKRYLQALRSQERQYTDDFVCDFIYGKTLDEYGINYYECALYKLLKQEGCPELAPLICQFDYVMAKHMNAELKRTKTLVTGGDFCDFWYIKLK